MKKLIQFFALLIIGTIASCKKNIAEITPLSSINITNAIINSNDLVLGNNTQPIANNASAKFTLKAGENDLNIYPIGDQTNRYYKHSLNAANGDIYSLFLTGAVPDVEGVLVKDYLPAQADSTAGVRFINLSPDSESFNITLLATPTVNEVSGLSYKRYTDFKFYQAKSVNTTYVFQVRKVSDNSLLTSYTLVTPRFSNVTLVILGLVRNSSIGITRVNNDRP